MIPEHANWLVENMSVTELHFYGSTLSSYPNVLSLTVEVISEHKPNQIHRTNYKNVDMGENPIPTWLTIDVLDKADLNVTPALEPMEPNGTFIGKHSFELKNVELKNDSGETLKAVVVVSIKDFMVDPDAEKDDFLKWARAMSIVFYV